MDPKGCIYAPSKNSMPGGIWGGGRNFIPEGYMYATISIDPVPSDCVWAINIGLVPGGCMGLIGIWTGTGADRPGVGKMAAGGGPLIDIWFLLPKPESYSQLIWNDANFSLSLHFINSSSV